MIARRGTTLMELIVAMLLFGVIITGALGFLAVQNRAFNVGADRMTTLQEMRYGIHSIAQDLKTIGINVPSHQPVLVYAGTDALSFSSDYTSNTANDFSAVYVDVNAPDDEVSAPGSKFTLPNTAFGFPDTLYQTGAGTMSPAELITFFFAVDSTTDRDDDYALWRQVNDRDPEILARHVLAASDSTPFFRYFHLVTPTGAAEYIDTIAAGILPLMHSEPIHGSVNDTLPGRLTDDIRAIRVSYRTTNGLTGANEKIVELTRVVTLPNAGIVILRTCGDEPILGTGITATAGTSATGEPQVALGWNAGTDETEGERDIIRYVLYRRPGGLGAWGDPYLSIPAGQATYTYVDRVVQSGELWQYGLAAQDCTPSLSGMSASTTVTIP